MKNITEHKFTAYIDSGEFTIPFNVTFIYNMEESALELYAYDIVYDQDYRGNSDHYKEFSKILKLHNDYELEGKLEILCWEYLDTLD